MRNRILAIIVTYNSAEWVDRCIGSLYESTVRADVMVIDNASRDNTVELVRTDFPDVRLVTNPENLGFGAANNIGLRYAAMQDYDFVYLMNADAWVEPDCIEKLTKAFKPGFGVLSPMQKDAYGNLDLRFSKKVSRFLRKAGDPLPEVVEVPFVMAAHWMISREALAKVGAFSPVFKHYGEDDNWIDRMHRHGFKAGVVTAADAVHDRSSRPDPKDRRMKLKCISTVVKVSNPCKPLWWMLVREPLELVGMSLKNFSPTPLKFLPVLFRSYPAIVAHRKKSFKEGAFLF